MLVDGMDAATYQLVFGPGPQSPVWYVIAAALAVAALLALGELVVTLVKSDVGF